MSQKFGTKITCLLCRGSISFKNGDRSRFLDHMNNEHDARYDFDVVLVVSIMTEGEKKIFVNSNQAKLAATLNTNKPKPVIPVSNDKSEIDASKSPILETKSLCSENIKEVEKESMQIAAIDREPEIEKVSEATIIKAPEREGVLKCKICAKYIKQSLMGDHKKTHAVEEEEEPVVPKGKDYASKPVLDIVKSAVVLSKISENDNEEESPKKMKRKGDDSDDEEWSPSERKKSKSMVATKKDKKIPCTICRKTFKSKLGLLSHERIVHNESRKSMPSPVKESHPNESIIPHQSFQTSHLSTDDPKTMQSSKQPTASNLQTSKLSTSNQQTSKLSTSNLQTSKLSSSNQQTSKLSASPQQTSKLSASPQQTSKISTSNQQTSKLCAINQQTSKISTSNQQTSKLPPTSDQRSTHPSTTNQQTIQPPRNNQQPTYSPKGYQLPTHLPVINKAISINPSRPEMQKQRKQSDQNEQLISGQSGAQQISKTQKPLQTEFSQQSTLSPMTNQQTNLKTANPPMTSEQVKQPIQPKSKLSQLSQIASITTEESVLAEDFDFDEESLLDKDFDEESLLSEGFDFDDFPLTIDESYDPNNITVKVV